MHPPLHALASTSKEVHSLNIRNAMPPKPVTDVNVKTIGHLARDSPSLLARYQYASKSYKSQFYRRMYAS